MSQRLRCGIAVVLLALIAGCAGTGRRPTVPGSTAPPAAFRGSVPEGLDPSQVVVWVEGLPGRLARELAPRHSYSRLVASGGKFSPAVIAVPTGSRVLFENRDGVYHSPFSISPARRFQLGQTAPGHSHTLTFDRPGVVRIYCSLHADEAGSIVVTASPLVIRPDSRGQFALASLPRGRYTVHLWHPESGEKSRRIDVRPGLTAQVSF